NVGVSHVIARLKSIRAVYSSVRPRASEPVTLFDWVMFFPQFAQLVQSWITPSVPAVCWNVHADESGLGRVAIQPVLLRRTSAVPMVLSWSAPRCSRCREYVAEPSIVQRLARQVAL